MRLHRHQRALRFIQSQRHTPKPMAMFAASRGSLPQVGILGANWNPVTSKGPWVELPVGFRQNKHSGRQGARL